jgi:hypothetical protein
VVFYKLRVVAPEAAGSNPVAHPNDFKELGHLAWLFFYSTPIANGKY